MLRRERAPDIRASPRTPCGLLRTSGVAAVPILET
jgi:hypothetical protein